MKKLAKAALAASVFFIPNIANAAPPDGTYTGTVAFTNGPTLVCQLSFRLSGGGTVVDNVTMMSADPLCSSIAFQNQPYSAAFSGSGSGFYAIAGVNVTFIIPPSCSGIILGTWSGSTIDINTTIGSCGMVGTVSYP
ncbi:hypothetical protein [Pedomonas mirosovicensis]|uniref:hypothetical protein n=1 Tax=Pedomonas mirosovicensis TaxID=2908641 RepID=UPI00216A83F5|nr:hypothetical protein [Pedomonas mirosovicensis]MCH8686329.1 hypothetical protein [Pedomonas mirosovicensis]